MKGDRKKAVAKTASFVKGKAAGAASTAASTAKKARATAAKAAKHAGAAVDAGQKKARTAYYKPVFPEEYAAPGYDRPKMIVIEDEDERKGIDVCEGAIGWFGKAADLEVLHLYEEAVPMSGVTFFPQPVCGAVYFENKLTPGRYINLDCYYDTLERDKCTELRRIAYDLGAKKCVLQSFEETTAGVTVRGSIGEKVKGPARLKREPLLIDEPNESGEGEGDSGKDGEEPVKVMASAGGSAQLQASASTAVEKSVVFSQTFEGNASPKEPELEWFRDDREIRFLIDTRCNGGDGNTTKEYHIQLDSLSTRIMSVELASRLESAVGKIGRSLAVSLEGEAKTEARKKLVFDVEF